MALAKQPDLLVMDVEGTDGREHGEDQDFERKSALFSLAVADVLIVNMWEHSVGLYNGANMGLLKTVFEVNLQLFGSKNSSKTKLFFVIRDFLGTTSLSNLAQTIEGDLNRIWASSSKPQNLVDCAISDFFDLHFDALPHKILKPDDFNTKIKEVSTLFYDSSVKSYMFNGKSKSNVPLDGLAKYCESIWEMIMTNKDLDLPTQQELVAQFRCEEIMKAVMEEFAQDLKAFSKYKESLLLIPNFGGTFQELKDKFISNSSIKFRLFH